VVFLAGMEEGLFPHSRSMNSEDMLEEERRLCYVGMTRAEKRLILTWARYRRRFGGGELERSAPSRFLNEVPKQLFANVGEEDTSPQVDLFAERHQVRESARRNTFTGKTYNSLDNISQFFEERGVAFKPSAGTQPQGAPEPKRLPPTFPSPASRKPIPRPAGGPPRMRSGMTVEHPRYGTGIVVRREGEGDAAKLTVSFPGHGLKKLVEKYAGLKARS
jgi:DNA helicase II / ATP-dependent DNA helicase PcrA